MSDSHDTDRSAGTYYALINTTPTGQFANQPFLIVNKLRIDERFEPEEVPDDFDPEPASEEAVFYVPETAELHRDAYHAAGKDHIELREVSVSPAQLESENSRKRPRKDDQPINFADIRESFELAMQSQDIPDDTVEEIVKTVEEAVANNEQFLMWRSDYEEFVSHIDGLLTSVFDNGYEEQVRQIDDLRDQLERAQD